MKSKGELCLCGLTGVASVRDERRQPEKMATQGKQGKLFVLIWKAHVIGEKHTENVELRGREMAPHTMHD